MHEKIQKISFNASEMDDISQHGVCMLQKMFISGQDQPEDQPEHQSHNICSHSFLILLDLSEFWGDHGHCLTFPT